MTARFIVISGLPASGKSSLARRLAPALGLILLDKDEILEELFELRGVGDAAFRRGLSREADSHLRARAESADGAVLVSHWHLPGMPADSGTPTGWLGRLPGGFVTIHCDCSAELAAARFLQRTRHPGHLDTGRSEAEVLASITEVAGFGPPDLAPRFTIDTSRDVDLENLLLITRLRRNN